MEEKKLPQLSELTRIVIIIIIEHDVLKITNGKEKYLLSLSLSKSRVVL